MNRSDKLIQIKEAKRRLGEGDCAAAEDILLKICSPDDDLMLQVKFALLARTLTSRRDLKPVRVAVLATSTVDQLIDSLRFWLWRDGFALEVFTSDFATIHQAVIDETSALYSFKPDITILLTHYRDFEYSLAPDTSNQDVQDSVDAAVGSWTSLWRTLRDRLGCHVIQSNADLPHSRVFGNYEANVLWSKAGFLKQINLAFARESSSQFSILDLEALSSGFGKSRWHDNRYWHHSKHAFALEATGIVAFEIARLIGAVKGRMKKCIVVDLDNTLWGGVVGDDGLNGILLGYGTDGEAFSEFQRYLLALNKRGIILAVCSKNEEANAREVFEKHKDMELGLGNIAVFLANWNNKADNINQIAQTLNIGLDSIVFVDDNPTERELVRSTLPAVSVPELPSDPSLYIETLAAGRYFEIISFSKEDRDRAGHYKANGTRAKLREQFSDIGGFLKSLEMIGGVGEFDDAHLPRIVQLINKSNQFHLTTTRYSEPEIRALVASADNLGLCFTLKDRLGDNGLIAAVLLRRTSQADCEIDTWVMSCRVLQRSMEEFICREIIAAAKNKGFARLIGVYRPTKKNGLTAGLYAKLGFQKIDETEGITTWELDLNSSELKLITYIEPVLLETANG